jgi:DNA invertase Pin-like site-specific DNA recombinase
MVEELPILTKQYNTAIYIRLSREDGDKEESNSVSVQRKMLRDFINNNEDLTLFDVYIDDGFTGTNFERPAFQRLITDIENSEVNCVVIKDLSRLGRDYLETGFYIEKFFPQKGIRFIAVNDHIDNKGDKEYDMLLPIRNIMNEQYARDISVKVQSSFKTKQRSGEFVGAFSSYGYVKSPDDKHKLVIDEESAQIVREIFQRCIDGCPKLRIAKELNEKGIPNPTEYKRLKGLKYVNSNKLNSTSYWTYSTISKILNNPMYLGHMVQGKTKRKMKGKVTPVEKENWIIVKNTHKAIISHETWDKAQESLSHRTREVNLNDNIGLFCGYIVCGDCGRAMHKKIDKGKYVYYRCRTYTQISKDLCTSHNISENALVKIIVSDINHMINQTSSLVELVKKQEETLNRTQVNYISEIEKIDKELQKIRTLKKSIYSDYKEDLISKEEYLSYREDYIKKEANLEMRIKLLDDKKQSSKCKNLLELDWVKRLIDLKEIKSLDRNIVMELINTIRIYENYHVKIEYKFSNDINLFQDTVNRIIIQRSK